MKRVAAVLLALVTLFLVASVPLAAAEAVDIETKAISRTTAYEDLSRAKEAGALIDMAARYGKKPTAGEDEGELITLVEVGYEQDAEPARMADYGLYVYVYCPSGKWPLTGSEKHAITLATSFSGKDANGEEIEDPAEWRAIDWKKYSMTMVNVDDSKTTGYSVYPVMKFKVNIPLAEIKNLTLKGARRYDVSEVEVHFRRTVEAKAFAAGYSFLCSGYREGFGNDAGKDTFTMATNKVDVVEIDVEQTSYKYANKEDSDTQTQLNTVYFSIDKTFFKQWDAITSIKAEWFEAHSTPIVVTSDQACYEELIKYLGQDLTEDSKEFPERTLATWQIVAMDYYAIWQYNCFGPNKLKQGAYVDCYFNLNNSTNRLCWLMEYPEGAGNDAALWGQSLVDTTVSSARLREYYKKYMLEHGSTTPEEAVLLGLLMNGSCDEGRTYGWQKQELGGSFDIAGYQYGDGFSGWWKRLRMGNRDEEDLKDIEVIEEVKESDIKALGVTDETLSRKYYVAPEDIADFKAYCNKAFAGDKAVIMLRFAVTDYHATPVSIFTNGIPIRYDGLAYVAQQTVFADFDILSFTCSKGAETVVVPVSMGPVTVIGGVDAPPDQPPPGGTFGGFFGGYGDNDWLEKLQKALRIFLGIMGALVVVILVVNLVGPVTTFAGAAGKGTGALVKKASKVMKPKRKKKKERRK